MSEHDSTSPAHKVTRQTLHTSGNGWEAYYSVPTFVLSCTCGWRAETVVARHAAEMTVQHEAGNHTPGFRMLTTTHGTSWHQL